MIWALAADAALSQTNGEGADTAAATLALHHLAARAHYASLLASDSSNFEALIKASMIAVDLGEPEPDRKKQEALYNEALKLARHALLLRPGDAEGHFHVSLALGVAAVSVGAGEKVKYAREIRDHAQEALRINPAHSGAAHVMGMWHAELMRLSGLQRLLARAFLGADFFGDANWEDAQRYLEKAAELEPGRLRHHLDLARVYADRDMPQQARERFERVIAGAPLYYNDAMYKEKASAGLARVKR
jgi:tetratricopeptide (TPR) repeat protein